MKEESRVYYYIEIEELARPIGNYHFAAKPIPSKGSEPSLLEGSPLRKEVWGETELEARAKVLKAMTEWGAEKGIIVTEIG